MCHNKTNFTILYAVAQQFCLLSSGQNHIACAIFLHLPLCGELYTHTNTNRKIYHVSIQVYKVMNLHT